MADRSLMNSNAFSLPSPAAIQPRFIRLRDAPQFFGMDKNRFNRDLRPRLTEIRIGKQGRAFDRLEMEGIWPWCGES